MSTSCSIPFRLRTKLDFEEVNRRIRSEYGTISEPDLSFSITNVEHDIRDCDSEMLRLMTRFQFVQNRRQSLERYKTHLLHLRSPIRRLANETLLEIFDFVCDTNELTSRMITRMPALALSSVNSRWRILSRSAPYLWARLHLVLEASSLRYRLFNHYINLSQHHALTIDFPRNFARGLQHSVVESVLRRLGSCANRIRSLTLELDSQNLDTLMRYNFMSLPNLEVLAIPSIFFPNPAVFQDISRLKSLSLLGLDLAQLDRYNIPWQQLISLDIAQCSVGIENLFGRCTNLQELRFRQPRSSLELNVVGPIIVPSVRKLVLSPGPGPAHQKCLMGAIFESFTLRALETLEVNGAPLYDHQWHENDIIGFISRSGFHLTSLTIRSFPIRDSAVISLLQQLPSLLDLTIDDSHDMAMSNYLTPITTRLIQRLNLLSPVDFATLVSPPVRNLQNLSLTYNGSEFDDQSLVDMISSRWFPNDYADESGTKIHSVVMRFTNRSVNEEIYRRLDLFRVDGLAFVVTGI